MRKRLEERHLVEAEVMFITEDDLYMAKSVDISGIGIRIVTGTPINIRCQIKREW